MLHANPCALLKKQIPQADEGGRVRPCRSVTPEPESATGKEAAKERRWWEAASGRVLQAEGRRPARTHRALARSLLFTRSGLEIPVTLHTF